MFIDMARNIYKSRNIFLQVSMFCLPFLVNVEAILSDPYIIEHPENKWVAKNEPASMTCKVEGKPPPVITWYRNGLPVITSSDDPESERMILPSGFLLIPRVSSSKSGKPDVGVYYCNATNPSTGNWVISRNATLDIAVLRDEFQEHPQDSKILVGTDAKLKCKPPKGEPDPKVKWRKDGQQLEITGRVFVNEAEGSLHILEAKKDDSGKYSCLAYNAGGEKESRQAVVVVREKPQIINAPKDVQVRENEDVLFECVATGEPTPTITWSRSEGGISPYKAVHLEDRGLKLSKVQTSDEDVYKCTAQNEVGTVEVEARLIVQSSPAFLVTPQDKVVGVGREVQLSCHVIGNPQPAIFWKKENIKTLMLQGESYGPFSVLKDGSLLIRSAIVEDTGEYTCQALSTAGAALSKARLTVKETYNKLPPIITSVPQNQTLPIEGKAILSCSATGDPTPSILWFRKDRVILPSDSRFTITDTGTLHIDELKRSDSGLYTCKASSESGDTTWSAYLSVPQSQHDRIFRGAPQPSAYPGPPTRPQVTEVTDTTAKVSWKRGSNTGLNPDVNYLVQAFCFSEGPGWITVASGVEDTSLIVTDLKPNSLYSFIVRANNSLGIGPPSYTSLTEKTKDFKRVHTPIHHLPNIIESHFIHPHNSSSINVSWSLVAPSKIRKRFDGILIKCQFMKYLAYGPEFDDRGFETRSNPQSAQTLQVLSNPSEPPPVVTEYIYSPGVNYYFITGLRKFALYELSILPFLRGAPSTEEMFAPIVEKFNTPEDVPSSPPLRIQAFLLNNNTFLRLSWKPPLAQDLNGRLKGYKIHVSSTDAKHSREMLVNSSVDSIEVYNLVRNVDYKIQLQAFNRVGDGPKSLYILPKPLTDETISVDRDNFLDYQQVQHKQLYNETWFLGVVFAFIACVIWLSFCIFCVLWYKKKRSGSTNQSKDKSKDAEAKRMINSTNQHQFGQARPDTISQQMSDSGSKNFPLLRYHNHHQAQAGNEQTTNLCHNCNNTLMTSCCYNESVSDGECCRSQQQQQQQQQQSHQQQQQSLQQYSPAMNHHTYYTLENQPMQQQYNNNSTTTGNNNAPVVHINNSSIATNRHIPTSHSNNFLNTGYPVSNYHTDIQPSSPVLGNYNHPHNNSANNNNNNNNYQSRSFRPIGHERESFIQHSSDEEIKMATMIPTVFQAPVLYLPPPPPIEEATANPQMFDFKMNNHNHANAAYYNELPCVTANFSSTVIPTVKAQIREYQIPQHRHATDVPLVNPFFDGNPHFQWHSELSHRDSDYDEDTETYNGTTNEEGQRSSSDEVSSIEDDSRFANKTKGRKKIIKNSGEFMRQSQGELMRQPQGELMRQSGELIQKNSSELINIDCKRSHHRDYDISTEYENGESFKLPLERCSDDIPRNVIKPLCDETTKAQ